MTTKVVPLKAEAMQAWRRASVAASTWLVVYVCVEEGRQNKERRRRRKKKGSSHK
jgi:hypothetical protein